MRYHDQLLEQAFHLANRERKRPRQASLRRAVSTAYYALFHLLLHEATLNWRQPSLRPTLARHFSHGKMKSAAQRQSAECNRSLGRSSATDPARPALSHLRTVSSTFVEVQAQRHTADYDNSRAWSRTEALLVVDRVNAAFESWALIRKEDLAQSFLLALLGPPRE